MPYLQLAPLVLLCATTAATAEDRVIKYDDTPPSTRTVRVSPVKAVRKRGGVSFSLGTIGVSRSGDVYLLAMSNRPSIYDPSLDEEREVPLHVPETLQDAPVGFVTFGSEGTSHVCYLPPSEQSRLVSYDAKGRVLRSVKLPVVPFLASAAVVPSGDLYLSGVSPRATLGGQEGGVPPMAPVLVIDKDGTVKGTLGNWDQTGGNPAEVALRNLRLVRANADGSVILFRKDRFEFEIYTKGGEKLRAVFVDARDQRKPHLYEKSDAGKPVDTSTGRKEVAPGDSTEAAGPGSTEASQPERAPGNSAGKGRSSRMKVDIPNVVRDAAVQKDRIYVLRNPYAHGGKEPKPVVDVFDTFGKWDEQIVLDSRERFDSLAVAPDGTLYLLAPQSEFLLWSADLLDQTLPPPTPPPAAR